MPIDWSVAVSAVLGSVGAGVPMILAIVGYVARSAGVHATLTTRQDALDRQLSVMGAEIRVQIDRLERAADAASRAASAEALRVAELTAEMRALREDIAELRSAIRNGGQAR